MNFQDLCGLLIDKRTSVTFLQQRRILHNGRTCFNNHNMTLSLGIDGKDRWRCRSRNCELDIPLRKGTWLENSHLSFKDVVLFLYCWSHELTSIKFCERELRISSQTIVDWNNFLREICALSLLAIPTIIGGNGLTVEVDESLFSKRKNNVGRILPQQWVVGGICRETGECFIYAVDNRNAATLEHVIRESIREGSTIITDLWRAYGNIPNMTNALGQPMYQHQTVNHSQNFVNPVNGANTQQIESTWNQAKRRNKRHCGTARHMMEGYLCEFMWRKRLHGADPFDAIMNDIAIYYPVQ